MYGCESWTVKKAECRRIDAFELWCWRRLLWVPWTARRSNQSILKEISPGCSIGRADAKAETPILWPHHAKSWVIGKDSDAGRDWGQKGTTEDEMAGWHHQLDGHEFEWTPGVGDGQGGLVCCSQWGRKELDMTERLNWTEQLWGHEWLTVLQSYLHWNSLCWGLEMWSILLGLRLLLWKTKKIILLSCQLNLEPMVLEINWAWIKINIGSTRIYIYKEGHLGWFFMLPA